MSNKQTEAFNEHVAEILADLQMQAMLFDVDVDIETLRLEPKSTYKEAFYITRWKEKEHGKDFDTYFDIDRE